VLEPVPMVVGSASWRISLGFWGGARWPVVVGKIAANCLESVPAGKKAVSSQADAITTGD